MKIHGDGSIVRLEDKPRSKCRKWRLVVDFGKDPITKKRKTKTLRFAGTYSEAKAALKAFIAELSSGLNYSARGTLFDVYAKKWLEKRKLDPDFRKGTVRKNGQHINALNLSLAGLTAQEITPSVISDMIFMMRTGEKSLTGQPMSGTYTRAVCNTLNSIMQSMVTEKIIAENPCADIKLPKEDTKEKTALSAEEGNRLIRELSEELPSARPLGVMIMIMNGWSREEVLGLSWRSFDQEKGTLSLREVLTAESSDLEAPKTDARTRTTPVHTYLYKRLVEWRGVQKKMLAAIAIEQTLDTPIITSRVGTRIHPNNLYKWWARWRKAHKFDGLNFHELRHTFATYMMAEGTDTITGIKLMGHNSSKMIERIYAHAVSENMENAVKKVGDRFTA